MATAIPIVSHLAKQSHKEKLAKMDKDEKVAYLKQTKHQQVSKTMEDDADQLETHFVENPFIKIRERAN